MGHLRTGLALFEVAEHAMGTPHLMHPLEKRAKGKEMFSKVMDSMKKTSNSWPTSIGVGLLIYLLWQMCFP